MNLNDEVRILEVMDFVVSTIHMQSFARIFTTDTYTEFWACTAPFPCDNNPIPMNPFGHPFSDSL